MTTARCHAATPCGRHSSRSTCSTTKSPRNLERYTAFVRQKAPGVTALATPRPLPVSEFQRRLRGGEVIVATLVTPLDLYVWGITHDKVVFVRKRVPERDVRAMVQRLRAGLLPSGAGSVPPFDAVAAHDIYKLVFEPLKALLQGATDVVWYGHGPLGAVPPAVLVEKAPAKRYYARRRNLRRRGFSSTATHSRRSRTFRCSLGIGTGSCPPPRAVLACWASVRPMLSADEVAGGPRSRSYELAGGLDGKALCGTAQAGGVGRRNEGTGGCRRRCERHALVGAGSIGATLRRRRVAAISGDRARPRTASCPARSVTCPNLR